MRYLSVVLAVLFSIAAVRAQDAPPLGGPSTAGPQVNVDLAEVGLAGHLTAGRVTVDPGVVRSDHTHAARTSIFVMLQGTLTDVRGGAKREYHAGDVVTVAEGVTHHAENHGTVAVVYIEINATANKK